MAAFAEQAGESAARPKEQHAHARFAKSKRFGNLAMVRSFDVREPHQLTLLGIEVLEHPRHVDPQRNVGTRHGARFGRLGASPAFEVSAAPVIDDQPAGDSEQPGAKLLGIVGWRRRSDEPEIAFLNDVVGIGRVSHDASGIRAKRAGRTPIEQLEGLFVDLHRLWTGRSPGRGTCGRGECRDVAPPEKSAKREHIVGKEGGRHGRASTPSVLASRNAAAAEIRNPRPSDPAITPITVSTSKSSPVVPYRAAKYHPSVRNPRPSVRRTMPN